MSIKSKFLTVAILGYVACGAIAQPAKPAADGIPEKITRAEALKQAGEGFDKIDTNHDGIVTRDEILAYRNKMQEAMSKMVTPAAAPHPTATPKK